MCLLLSQFQPILTALGFIVADCQFVHRKSSLLPLRSPPIPQPSSQWHWVRTCLLFDGPADKETAIGGLRRAHSFRYRVCVSVFLSMRFFSHFPKQYLISTVCKPSYHLHLAPVCKTTSQLHTTTFGKAISSEHILQSKLPLASSPLLQNKLPSTYYHIFQNNI